MAFSNGTVKCNQTELNGKLPSSAIIPSGYFPPSITYWILDSAGNGKYSRCPEFDMKGDVIRAGSTDGEHDIDTIECPIDRDLSRHPRPVIIKTKEVIKTKACVSLPAFHPCEIKESFFTYRYNPPQISSAFNEADENFPNWRLMLLLSIHVFLT